MHANVTDVIVGMMHKTLCKKECTGLISYALVTETLLTVA